MDLYTGFGELCTPPFNLLGLPILGKWSDEVGRKKVLMVSQIGTFIAWVLFIAAISLPVKHLLGVGSDWLGSFALSLPLLPLFLARPLDGLTRGNKGKK